MIRFINSEPKYVWLSQHANGEAYTFSALQKDSKGKRVSRISPYSFHNICRKSQHTNPPLPQPIIYSATGSHALYATTGTHDHTIPNLDLPTPLLLVDYTDAGPFYDPVLSSYTYTYTLASKTFNPTSPTPTAPISFLTYTGHWGDAEYPETDPKQKGKGLFGFKKYVGGPTGPADKGLDRKEVWPEGQFSGGQRIRTSLDGSSWVKDLFKGWFGIKKMVKRKRERKMGVRRVDVSGREVKR